MKHSCMAIGLSPNGVQVCEGGCSFSYTSLLRCMAVGLKMVYLILFTTYSIREACFD